MNWLSVGSFDSLFVVVPDPAYKSSAKILLNYRTGSGSDLAVSVPLNLKIVCCETARSLPLPVL